MSRWMTDVTQLLQQRLDADVLAGDVPEEFQVYSLRYFIIYYMTPNCYDVDQQEKQKLST